jgi:hypothetical protein
LLGSQAQLVEHRADDRVAVHQPVRLPGFELQLLRIVSHVNILEPGLDQFLSQLLRICSWKGNGGRFSGAGESGTTVWMAVTKKWKN